MTKPTPTDQPSHSDKPRSSFSGKMGYVLAVAGSAVGLGNIWRFPYLAAKYGGGIFLLVYLVLMLTFGYALIVSETALGRMTKKSPVGAFRSEGTGILIRPLKYAPVMESGLSIISCAVPVAITSPPCSPALGPISTI